jgi:hypothetical protein
MIFLRWLNEVRKELKALFTGSLLLVVLGLYQTITTRVVAPWIYGVVVAVFLGWAFFGAWAKEHHQRLVLEECVRQYRDRATAITWMSHFVDEANSLTVDAPNEDATKMEIARWRQSVELWRNATTDALLSLSLVAKEKFFYFDTGWEPSEFAHAGKHRNVMSDLHLLDERRRNLREIMEKADVYLARVI